MTSKRGKDDILDWILSAILLILGMLIFNLGLTGFILRSTTGNRHDIKNLEKSFNALAGDFKKHREDREIHYHK